MPGEGFFTGGNLAPVANWEGHRSVAAPLSSCSSRSGRACVDIVLQGCTGTCTELTSLCSSSSQNKLRTSALKLAALTACHLHVTGSQHRPYSCPPAAHAMKAGDGPSQAVKCSTGSCNMCHLLQENFKTLSHIPCFTTTVVPSGKAERLLPSAHHWA